MTETRKKIRVNPMMPTELAAQIAQNTWESSDAYAERKPGDQMPDGSIYLSCYDNKDWFVTAEDAKDANGARLRINFNTAAQYAKNLKLHGHSDWVMPDRNILDEMFCNRNAGAFSGGWHAVWHYGSSTPYNTQLAYARGFSSATNNSYSNMESTTQVVRCVRSVPRNKP